MKLHTLPVMCVTCRAWVYRDGHGTVHTADYVLDGMSLCEQDASPMIKLIAERMPSGQHADDTSPENGSPD